MRRRPRWADGSRRPGTGDRPLDELADGLAEFGAGVTDRADDIALLLLRARLEN